MDADRVDAITALLSLAEEAHGAYETTELNGVYDEQWPRWYAEWAVGHGVGPTLGHDVTADRLAEFFASGYGEFEQLEPTPAEGWAAYTARRIVAEL